MSIDLAFPKAQLAAETYASPLLNSCGAAELVLCFMEALLRCFFTTYD